MPVEVLMGSVLMGSILALLCSVSQEMRILRLVPVANLRPWFCTACSLDICKSETVFRGTVGYMRVGRTTDLYSFVLFLLERWLNLLSFWSLFRALPTFWVTCGM